MGDDTDAGYVAVTDLETLREEGRMLRNLGGQAIAVFYHEGDVRAIDNRCPHMGFPLTEGTIDDGVLTCHWHHARFELSCGDTFDPWADDVPTYPVEIDDGQVRVKPVPDRDAPPAEHWRTRLDVGLEENLSLVLAKAAIGLASANVDPDVAYRRGVEFGTEYNASGWGSGLTIHTAMHNVGPVLDDEDRQRATYVGLTEVASDCAGSPPRFDQPALGADDVGKQRLKEWFRDNVEVRDTDGAERTLRAAVQQCDPSDVAEITLAAATDHRYLSTGHALDHLNKAFEALEYVGYSEYAAGVLASTVDNLTDASRAEESSSWRKPIDIAGLIADVAETLPDRRPSGSPTGWVAPEGFTELLLADDPHRIVDGVADAIDDGASPADIAAEVVYAAGIRVAQFSSTNEFSDWNTVHHTFTYANAVHGMTRRTDAWEGYRGVLDAAMKVYLDRFLNMPPASIPAGDATESPSAVLDEILETFEREGAVDEVGERTATYLASGGRPDALWSALGGALLREDAGFHVIQNFEAAYQQAMLTDDPERVKLFLVATARYLCAHTPTRREREQTFTIAQRLHRGERIHEAASQDRSAPADD